jgi:HEPN domain-containing protein
MPPTSSRDFQKAAAQRFISAETLLRAKRTLDAQYLGGYTVECTLKALILELTPGPDKTNQLKRITSGAIMHQPAVLLGELRNLGSALPLMLSKRLSRLGWTTDLRYETAGRDRGETVAFLKTARAIYEWVEVQLP